MRTKSIPSGALTSLSLIVRLWENKSLIRKLFIGDFIRGVNVDIPKQNSLSEILFHTLNTFIGKAEFGDLESVKTLDFLIQILNTQKFFFDEFLKYDPEDTINRHHQSFFVKKIQIVVKKLNEIDIQDILTKQYFMQCISKITELISNILQRDDLRPKILDEIRKYV